jgi:hypothetical protein
MLARATADLRSTAFITRLLGIALFLSLVLIYHANTSVSDEGDAVPSVELPYALLKTGKLTIDPERSPKMFLWRGERPLELPDGSAVPSWNTKFDDKTLAEWRNEGRVALLGPRYFLVESLVRDAYLSTFGPIPGLFTLPLAALVSVVDPGVVDKPMLKLAIAKLTASMLIAGCAVLIFVIALRRTDRARALLVAVVYGLGSCAWAVSSQTIWQQTVTQFFLILGASFFLGALDKPRVAALAGFAFGAALAVRATAAVVLLSALVYLCLYRPRSLAPFLLGALPVPLVMAVYNFYYFGNPLVFAQGLVGHAVALEKTGSPELWQTPPWRGLIGLLISPSRGLLIFSPVLALAGWGIVKIWRKDRFRTLRPLTISALVMMAIQCAWFDWWGGWAYGYRPWLDVLPLLALFIVPVEETATATDSRRAAFGVVLIFSIFVQALGAFSYDKTWNDRELFLVRLPDKTEPVALFTEDEARAAAREHKGTVVGSTQCNIDLPECRYRLWSLRDSLLVYQFTHYSVTRARRLPAGWSGLWGTEPRGLVL